MLSSCCACRACLVGFVFRRPLLMFVSALCANCRLVRGHITFDVPHVQMCHIIFYGCQCVAL